MQHTNTLGVIHTQTTSRLLVREAFEGPYTSDHWLVGIELEVKNLKSTIEQQPQARNYKEFDPELFSNHFSDTSILEKSSLEEAVEEFRKRIEKALDKTAPMEPRLKKNRKKNKWYTPSLLDQRKMFRN